MNCLVIYDVRAGREGNRVRTKLADLCMDYGMNRIQYSAFAGDLQRTHQEELFQRAQRLLGKTAGKVYLYPIGEGEWRQRLCHERRKVPAMGGGTGGGEGVILNSTTGDAPLGTGLARREGEDVLSH